MKGLILALILAFSAAAQTVVATFDAPDTNISGLAYGAGSLWAVDGTTDYLYSLNPSTGAITGTYYLNLGTTSATGLGFGSNQIYVGLSTGYINYYNISGTYLGQFSALC
jgi:hypothetical protein